DKNASLGAWTITPWTLPSFLEPLSKARNSSHCLTTLLSRAYSTRMPVVKTVCRVTHLGKALPHPTPRLVPSPPCCKQSSSEPGSTGTGSTGKDVLCKDGVLWDLSCIAVLYLDFEDSTN
ncbi:hypothetical protein LEMLEM_LOCUS20322, partial [Lemmus lemmus]